MIFSKSKESINDIDKLVKSYKNLNIEQAVAKMRTDGVADAEIRATLAKQDYIKTDIEQAMAEKATNTAKATSISLTRAQTVGLTALSVAAKAANIALTAGIGILVSFAATGFISWIDNVINKQKNLSKAAEEAKSSFDELNNTLSNQKKTVSEYSKEYAELAQGVNLLNNQNLSLSTEDYERFLELTNELSKTFPELTKGVDDNGNAILDLDGNVNTIVDSLNNLIEVQQKLANQEMTSNISKIYEDYYNDIIETNKKIDHEIKEQEERSIAQNVVTDLIQNPSKTFVGDFTPEQLELENALDDFEIEYKVNATVLDDGSYGFVYEILDSVTEVNKKIEKENKKSVDELEKYQNQIKSKTSEIRKYISTYLSLDYDFTGLEDNLKIGINDFFTSFDPTNLPDNVNAENWTEVYEYLKDTYLYPISKLDIDVQEKLGQIFNKPVEMSDKEYIKLADDLQQYFDDNEIEIDVSFIVEDEKELQARFNNIINKISKGDSQEKDVLFNFINDKSIDTSSEIESFISVVSHAESAKEAIELYLESLKKVEGRQVDFSDMYEDLDSIRNAYQTVTSAIEEYNDSKSLSLETVESLLQLDDKYLAYLYDENGQLTLNKDAYNALTKAKLDELQVGIVQDTLNTISNLESEEAALKYLEETTVDLTKSNWELVRSTIAAARAKLLDSDATEEEIDDRLKALDQIEASIEAKKNLYDEAINGMNKSNFYGGSSSKKEAKEFSQTFDWISNSVDNVNNSIERLNNELSNATGFKERLSLYDKLNKENQKLVDTTKDAADAYESEWIKVSNKISGSYKNKIVSKNTFSIETITNETTANNIEEAQKAYSQWQSALQEYNDAIQNQKKTDQDRINTLLELEQIKLEIISLDDEEGKSSIQKNNRLLEEQDIKKKILEYNLLLATSEEEKLKLQKEYNAYLEDNEKLIYENHKQERENKNSFYESRVNDIQNEIDLTEAQGSQGTEKQYRSMNDYIDNQIKLEEQNYEAALKMRDLAKYGTEEWDKYNQEIQDAQNNINQLTIQQIENNRAILLLPVQKYEKLNEKLEEQLDSLNEYKNKVDNAIGYANTLVQDQIDLLDKNKEDVSEYWDNQINAVQEQKDALTENNDELQRQIDLEKAKFDLEQAINNKTNRVYREGEGFVFEADQDAILDAKENLDNQEYENAIADLDKTIDVLTKQKESALKEIEDQIESWQKYSEQIDKVTSSYERFIAMQDFIAIFGSGSIEDIMNQDNEIIGKFEETLNTVKFDVDEIQSKLDANNKLIEAIQKEADAYLGSSKDIIDARNKINQLIIDNTKEISAIDERSEKAKELAQSWSETESNITTALSLLTETNVIEKDKEKEVLSERLENLKEFKKQAIGIYSDIAQAVNNAKTALEELERISAKSKKVESNNKPNNINNTNKSNSSSNKNSKSIKEYHTGGIVGKSLKPAETLYGFSKEPLKPNEVYAKLLENELVLNNTGINNVLSYIPDLTKIKSNNNDNKPVTVNVSNISLPNVKSGNDAEKLFDGLINLSKIANQEIHKR